MSFSHWPAQSCIHLVDQELPRSINVKYGTVTIPQQTKKIFTSNKDSFIEIFCYGEKMSKTDDETNAIERRVHKVYIQNKLF